MLNDPIVIVGAARTPMGALQGDFASLSASDLGAVAIKAAVERAGIKPADVDETIMGNVLPAGQGQAPARQASIKAGLPLSTGAHDRQQDVRLGDEGRDARARPPRRGHERRHGRGRHGVDEQRAVPAAEGARRLPHGPPERARPHVPRRARGRLRQGPADGDVRRGVRDRVRIHPRSAGPVRARLAVPRARREQRRHVRMGDRAGDRAGAQGRRR